MKHLSPKQVLQARHYHAAGWSVAELARLLGHTRDTISKVVNGHTHTNVVRPEGYVVPQLPSRPPPKPHVRRPGLSPDEIAAQGTPEERLRKVQGLPPKPVQLNPGELAGQRILAEKKRRGY